MAASKPVEPESVPDSEPGLGARLRTARVAQNLSLDDLAAELRLGSGALLALEEERFEALGAPVFARGYLKHYAARLGLDVKELVAAYDESPASSRVSIAPSRSIRLRDERQIAGWIIGGIALVLVAAFLVFWWLGRPESLFG